MKVDADADGSYSDIVSIHPTLNDVFTPFTTCFQPASSDNTVRVVINMGSPNANPTK